MSNLNPVQFFNQHSDNYDAGGRVSPTVFGLPLATPEHPGPHFSNREPAREVDVPLSQVRAHQDWVKDTHVRNLATVPREAFEKIHAVPDVREHYDGTYRINEGTHRAAAAHLRGDETLRVRVTGRWNKP
jgi:hypothetical protein